jgi:hypothetical protein
VDFDRLDMTVPSGDDGYARSEAPLAEVIRRAAAAREEPVPIVVWIHGGEDRDLSDACDAHLRADWRASLALDRFVRYRVNLDSIRREELREGLRAPAYLFFDPTGEEISRVEGERAADCDSFERALERAWRTVYEQRRKRYVKAMEDLLEEKEKIAERRGRLEEERRELADERNALRKQRALDREEEKLERELEEILGEERETRSALAVREEYREEE